MTWTLTDIERLQTAGKIRGHKVIGKEPVTAKKGSKYKNVRCEYQGLKFDSAKERDRYITLKVLETQGIITDLKHWVKYLLIAVPNAKYQLAYIADFTYMRDGELVVEDVKPFDRKTGKYLLSALFKRKAKLMKRVHGITIKIV